MRVITYFISLLAAAATYFLFAAYLTVSAGLDSILPLISFYSAILVFGFFSWFHLFSSKAGAILLILALLLMFFSWPVLLFVEHFTGEYKPSLIESLLPFTLIIIPVALAWWSYGKQLKMRLWLKYALALPPALLAIYVGLYFTLNFFFIN